jgi:2-C-methyl-D-erythritol 4-phosphate cytidylyltransferase
MRAVLEAARESKAAGAFLQPDVPVARIRDGLVVEDFQRGQIGIFQAPQAFERTLLAKVLAEADARGWKEQSTIQLVLRTGIPVRAIPGEKTNIKLTTEEDWRLAQSLIEWLV